MPIIAIEGIDGSGKTTQAKMLMERLSREGYRAVYVQPAYLFSRFLGPARDRPVFSPRRAAVQPDGSKSFMKNLPLMIRKWLLGLFGYLYALATCLFLRFRVGRNRIAVCDRFFNQFFFDLFGDKGDKALRLLPKPDITFFLAGDLDYFRARMEDSDSMVEKDYYARAFNFYEKASQKQDFIRVDGSLDKSSINDIIFGILLDTPITRKAK